MDCQNNASLTIFEQLGGYAFNILFIDGLYSPINIKLGPTNRAPMASKTWALKQQVARSRLLLRSVAVAVALFPGLFNSLQKKVFRTCLLLKAGSKTLVVDYLGILRSVSLQIQQWPWTLILTPKMGELSPFNISRWRQPVFQISSDQPPGSCEQKWKRKKCQGLYINNILCIKVYHWISISLF